VRRAIGGKRTIPVAAKRAGVREQCLEHDVHLLDEGTIMPARIML